MNDRRFRGAVRLLPHEERGLLVINEVDLESYLRGVVGVEMSPTFAASALEAQAVVARTYALQRVQDNRARTKPRPWDLTDEPSSQVYRGQSAESLRTDRAVARSRGLVLYRGEEMAECYYHSSCGGRTSDGQRVFSGLDSDGREDPGADCESCRKSGGRAWELALDRNQLERAAEVCGARGEIREIYSGAVDVGGRWIELKIRTDRGLFSVPANRFRLAVGSHRLRSTLIDEVRPGESDGGVSLEGRGFGHGVGLCQIGADRMGDAGRNRDEILRHYYRGTESRRVYGEEASQGLASD